MSFLQALGVFVIVNGLVGFSLLYAFGKSTELAPNAALVIVLLVGLALVLGDRLRAVGPGSSSTIHYDVVYMGRGTRNLYTCWTPFGRITPDMGPLTICLGSNQWREVIDTYGRSDVDRDLTCGYFTKDPAELVDKFGRPLGDDYIRAGRRGDPEYVRDARIAHERLESLPH